MTGDSFNLLSVGIDVGTTTTQLVLARLVLAEAPLPGRPPRIAVRERSILRQAPVILTPQANGALDLARLVDYVLDQYAAAGIPPADVQTGAVIITGEAVKKENVEEVLRTLSGLAGDFVAATAGPRLEAIIAGRGSGAAAHSRGHFTDVTNVDIGGGTTNLATFRNGELVAASGISVGGRLIEIDARSGRVTALAGPALPILDFLGMRMAPGDRPELADLRRFTDAQADLILDWMAGRTSPLLAQLSLTPLAPPTPPGTCIMFSGGVGHYLYHPAAAGSVAEVALHGDLGPLLAVSLRTHPGVAAYRCLPPAETLHATVLGAGSQMLTLSGSTTWLGGDCLPLRNLPVVRVRYPGQDGADWKAAAALRDLDPLADPFGLAVDLDAPLDFQGLVNLARVTAGFARDYLTGGRPLVLLLELDYARALGQFVAAEMPALPLIVLDQLRLEDGDIVDIGAPLLRGRAVPVVVKTLVYYH